MIENLFSKFNKLKKPVHNKKKLKDKRKELRNNLTSAEDFLWNELMGKKT